MNLERILDKCHRGQWSMGDLDWSVPPRAMTRDEEVAIVQYFTDMSGIERLAKALFEEQRRRSQNIILREIFTTFMEDEERHARVAERLAHHYNVHGYRTYELNPDIRRFAPVFIDAIRYISAEFANVYITTGELLLDVALLRSLADYVDDDMCRQAMTRIDRDESRHIAIDYYMTEYYASPAYRASVSALNWRSAVKAVRALSTFTRVLYYAGPFARSVFVEPLDRVDPSGRRMREAFKRIQLLGRKPEIAALPFSRFMRALQSAYNTPVLGRLLGSLITRVAGVPGVALLDLVSEEEARRVVEMSYEQLADEALAAKYCD